jgi:RNA polymerase sporulation-specific sigma factor
VTEEQLAIRVGAGDSQAFEELGGRMHGLIRSIARRYYAPGLDRDDLFQAGLVGLWRGCLAYNPELRRAGTHFHFTPFAVMCIDRSIQTSVKTALRLKHEVVSRAISLDGPAGASDDDPQALHEAVPSRALSAHELLEQREEVRKVLDAIPMLTALERESLIGFVFNGESYEEIEARIVEFDGDRPGRAAYSPIKVVDNALSRARWKIRLALAEDPERLPFGVAA